jgi:hypothetical protein
MLRENTTTTPQKKMFGDNSAFKVLIDKSNFVDATASRGERTKSLLRTTVDTATPAESSDSRRSRRSQQAGGGRLHPFRRGPGFRPPRGRARATRREVFGRRSESGNSMAESEDGDGMRRPPRARPNFDQYGLESEISDEHEDLGSERETHNDGEPLSDRQRRVVLDTIREYCPQGMQDVVYEDVIQQMNQLEEAGYKLPKGYNKRKHNMDENEIRLYEQQISRDKARDKQKMNYMLNFGAMGLSWFCQSMSVDWLKTRYLPKVMRAAVDDGEFVDCLDGIGSYLRGTVFESPVLSTVLKFMEKIGEAHHKEMEEETDRLEEFADKRHERKSAALKSLNRFRNAPPSRGRDAKKPQPTLHGVPVPGGGLGGGSRGTPRPAVPGVVFAEPDQKPPQDVPPPQRPAKEAAEDTQPAPPPQKDPGAVAGQTRPEVAAPSKRAFARLNDMKLPKNIQSMVANLKGPMDELNTMMQDDESIEREHTDNPITYMDMGL